MRLPIPLFVACLCLVAFAGCVDDADVPAAAQETPTGPPAQTVNVNTPWNDTITRFGDPLTVSMPGGGQGIWLHDDILYWTNGADLHLADASDPQNITRLGSVDGVGARDVDVLPWEGRTYAVLAGSGAGIHVIDATDPTAPELLTTVQMPSAGVHNLAAVTGTPYVYSSGASGQTKRIDVLDLSDPANPQISFFPIPATMDGIPVESDGCHDISVRWDLRRAYCAGGGGTYTGLGGESFIWDISEEAGGPADPEWVVMIDDPRIKYHHQALVNDDGTILILDDEHIVANNCVREDVGPLPGDLDPQIPIGAAWIYDISDEENPVLEAIVQNPQTFADSEVPTPNVNCGSHFGDIILGQPAFVMGWYTGGTILVDFSTPSEPQVLDITQAGGSHWDARYWKGHIYHAGTDLVVTGLE